MKVLHFTNTIRRGGAERQQATIIKHSKFDEILTTLHYNDKSYFDENEVVKLTGSCLYQKARCFRRLVAKENPDIIYAWSTLTYIIASLVCIFNKIKIINGSVRHGIFNYCFSGYFRLIILHLSKYVVSNSEAGLRANLLSIKKNHVLYNGKESEFSEKITQEEKFLRKVELFPTYKNEIVFISVANFVPFKDYYTIIDALDNCKNEIDFRYIILGDGPLFDEVKDYIEAKKMNKVIAMMGSVTNVTHYYQIADVMLHSSKGEGISNALVEAMFAGLPIISTNVGGVPETVFKKTAFLYNYKNVEELTECLLKAKELIRTSKDYERELEQYLRKFSTQIMIEKYHEIIKKIALN